jgi:hypothetical protein
MMELIIVLFAKSTSKLENLAIYFTQKYQVPADNISKDSIYIGAAKDIF